MLKTGREIMEAITGPEVVDSLTWGTPMTRTVVGRDTGLLAACYDFNSNHGVPPLSSSAPGNRQVGLGRIEGLTPH